MSAFKKRLDAVGKKLDVSAVDPRKLKPPFKTEICLQRVLVVDDGDGLGGVINGVVHCELAPAVVGGFEALRIMLAAGDLMRDWLAESDGARLGSLAGEMREALQRINELADSVTAAKKLATAEHDAFHHAEAKAKKGAVH
ncbi:MAG: hypothetical protein DI536_29035 [Archangium gephyra]|uniref:Uncharacterized protein n=1 Tax=Archangium gephyra TaxID=48 RepID=A0A2W5UUT9_9BACT|nr:MAG: hypothetical protein DI536_29035 [Archangium gephyra]